MEKQREAQRVKEALATLKQRGWTTAAIADELAVNRDSVWGWETDRYRPSNPRSVRIAMEGLLRRRRIPKRKRYKKNPPAT
jgi:DNA-binding XRE family transcriptional regulator